MSKYPYWSVVITFSFSPILGGMIMGALMIFFDNDPYKMGAAACFILYVALLLMASFFAMIFQFIPSIILGFLFANLELEKGITNYIFVATCGGVLAFLWMCMIDSPDTLNPVLQNLPAKSFILGVLCSLSSAIYSFPKRNTDSAGEL